MPAYSATGNRVALYQPGDAFAVWNADTQAAVTASPASQQVALGQTNAEDSQSASVEIKFSGAPGAFSFTIQTADTDVDAAYTNLASASAITAVNTGNYASYQLTDLRCNFMRLYAGTPQANNVTVTATITR